MPPSDEGTQILIRHLLETIQEDREESREFRSEIRESLRAQRQESHSFRDEIRGKVDVLEDRLDVKDAADRATDALISRQKKLIITVISVLATVGGAVAPYLFGAVVKLL